MEGLLELYTLVLAHCLNSGMAAEDAAARITPKECNEPINEESFKQAFSEPGTPVIYFVPVGKNGKYLNFTDNLRTKACDKGVAKYLGTSGGTTALLDDLQAAWDQGLLCLHNLAQRHSGDSDPDRAARAKGLRRAARNIMGNLVPGAARRFTLVCEFNASRNHRKKGKHIIFSEVTAKALTCTDKQGNAEIGDDVPGIAVNMANFRTLTKHKRRAMLFHELLHHIPIFHNIDSTEFEFDLVHALQKCCFGDSKNPLDPSKEQRAAFPPDSDSCQQVLDREHGK